jgi:hypothetical protein
VPSAPVIVVGILVVINASALWARLAEDMTEHYAICI